MKTSKMGRKFLCGQFLYQSCAVHRISQDGTEKKQTEQMPKWGSKVSMWDQQSTQDTYQKRQLALICESTRSRADIIALAHKSGCSISDNNWDWKNNDIHNHSSQIDLWVIDLRSVSDRQREELSNIALYLESSGNEALIWTDMECLEEAYAAFPNRQCHFLVDASDVDAMLIMSGAIRRGNMDQLHDNSRDGEFGSLYRISDELAGFARTLAQLATNERTITPNVSEKPLSFRPANPSSFAPFEIREKTSAPVCKSTDIRDMIKLRRTREKYLNAELFADPAWDILLDLMAAKLENKQVSVSSLCIAASVPATTALRWITGMTESGLLVRHMDPKDARRVFIALSDDTALQMHRLLNDIMDRSSILV
jgi:hypothetical protein